MSPVDLSSSALFCSSFPNFMSPALAQVHVRLCNMLCKAQLLVAFSPVLQQLPRFSCPLHGAQAFVTLLSVLTRGEAWCPKLRLDI